MLYVITIIMVDCDLIINLIIVLLDTALRRSHQTSHGYIAGIGSIVYVNIIIKPTTIVSLSIVHTVLLLLYWT